MSDTVELWKNGNEEFEIFYSEADWSPREDDGNVGVMLCKHRRYNLGDVQCTDDELEERLEEAKKNAIVMLPVYMFELSGIALSTRSKDFSAWDSQGWDWGQVGVIYADKNTVEKCFGDETPSKEKITEILENEVEIYGKYLNGESYGFEHREIKTCSLGEEHSEVLDSCYGFYYVEDAKSYVDLKGFELVEC